jgi:thioesterase domain-containing protein
MTDATGNLAARLLALDPDRRRLLLARLRPAGGAVTGDAGPVPLPRGRDPLPASFAQERLWLADQLVPATSAYLTWLALRLTGPLRVDLLCQALDAVLGRHEILRTGLRREGGRLVQHVRDSVPVPLKVLDVRSADDPWQAAERLLRGGAETGFELAAPPLLRVRLVRLADEDHVLGVYLHHAVTDGWSNGLLLRDLGTAYRGLLGGTGPGLPPPRLQYGDVAAWQRAALTEERRSTLLGYWTEQLSGIPAEPVLPLDRPRRADGSARGERHPFAVPAATANRLRRLAGEERATTFMVVLAGLAVVLARWSGEPDVVVGSTHGGRTHPDLEDVLGPMVNSVVMRVRLAGRPTGRQLLRQARRVALDAQAHADLPFERLVEHLRPRRSATYHPVFQVNLGLRNFPQVPLELPGVVVSPVPLADTRAAKFDLSWYLSDGAAGGWSGEVEYNAGLFTAGTVERLAGAFDAVLAGIAGEPDRPVGELPLADLPTTDRAGAAAPAPDPVGDRVHVPPRDRWEGTAAQVFSQVLGVDGVGAGSDFFELGGHSMAAMLVVERLRQLTGRRVGLATLFRRPTVEGLAAALRDAGSDPAAPYVVELNPAGSGPPLFFAHSAVGELAMYFPLARELAGSRPLYGMQPDGFFRHGDPGDLTLDQLADRYAEEIARIRPDGPYHLCGFSAAGRLAVAVAARLAAAGRSVGAVLLLDSAPYGDVAPDPGLATVLARWLPFAPPAAALAGLDRDGLIVAVLAAGQRAGAVPPGLGAAEFARWCRRIELGARALAGHGPLGYPGTVTLLVRAGRTDRDIAAEWGPAPVGALRVEPVPVATHESFVEGESVPAVARRLAAHLARADGEGRQP